MFKLRTYIKTGTEKGNLEKELFFSSAEAALEEYVKLFRKELYSLNPTLWSCLGGQWKRYNERDFETLFTGGKREIDITKESVNCCNELVVDTEKDYIEAYYELWADVDRYFGTNTRDDDSAWINFYTYWHPDGHITASYYLEADDTSEEYDWPLTEEEQEFFRKKMEEYCQFSEHASLQEVYEEELKESQISSVSHVTVSGKDYLSGPISQKHIQEFSDENHYIEGVVKVHISDMIDNNLEGFLDLISIRLVDSDLLMDVNYNVIGLCEDEPDTLYLLVRGDASMVLDDAGDEETEE